MTSRLTSVIWLIIVFIMIFILLFGQRMFFVLFVSINVYKMAPELTPLIWKNSGREKEGQTDAAIEKEAYFM